MTTSYSTKELMACVIARDLKDGEDLQVGFKAASSGCDKFSFL